MGRNGQRAVSEGTGVVTLVLVTLLVTGSVGMSVLIAGDSGGGQGDIDGDFRFEQFDQRVLLTYESGPGLTAGNLYAEASANNVTWAELAGIDEGATVTPGDTQQLAPAGAYGSAVAESETVTIVYITDDGERVVIDSREP